MICSLATSNFTPIIPNKKQEQFEKYLKRYLPYSDEDIQEICFNLWYRAMHEDDKDFDENTAEEYFQNEVINSKRVFEKHADEAMRQLKAYMDHIPRWTLKGYSTREL